MEITTSVAPSFLYLSKDFLEPYYKKGDPFTSLLARSTYLTKYCRWNSETWTDTIKRVVEGSAALDPSVSQQEAELLFHYFWTGQALPPGRGLWTGGVPGIPADARFNCFSTTLYSIDDWCWTTNQLMLGGGVGLNLGSIGMLPTVVEGQPRLAAWCSEDHPDYLDVKPEGPEFLNGSTPKYHIEDSREGWVTALRKVLEAAFDSKDLVVDASDVRPRGALIRTFGGIACGPGPLVYMLRSVWRLVRGAAGRKLTSVECLDITDHIGLCIKSGNVRRSALLVLGDPDDQVFRDAKKDFAAVLDHRHTSNNSLAFRSFAEIERFDWASLVKDNVEYGEPGVANLALVHKTDPEATGVNPCFSGDTRIAVADGRNSVTIKQLAEEDRDVPVYSMNKTTGEVEIKMGRHPRITGYRKALVRVWLDDGSFLDVTPDHKFILLDGSMIEASSLESGVSLPRFTKTVEKVKRGSKDYYLVNCDTRDPVKGRTFEHRLIAKFYFFEDWDRLYDECLKAGFVNTGGLVVHHKDYNQLNNSPDNLQIMTFKEHTKLHGDKDNSGESNGRWSGVASSEIKEKALQLTISLGRRFTQKDWASFARDNGLPQQFSKFRVGELGTVPELAELCAAELGYEHVAEDARVIRTYCSMLEQGYSAEIIEGEVLVTKTCERCSTSFKVKHAYRERAFCSEQCGNAYVNEDPAVKVRRVAGMDATYSVRMQTVRVDQARVCSALKFKLGREPNRKEWSIACKQERVTSRIGPTLKFGYKQFKEVLEAGANYNHKVVRVDVLPGEHTVYNITVDDFHTVAVITSMGVKRGSDTYTGVHVVNCGEQFLHDREACNLAEVFPARFESGTDPETVFRLATRYCIRQRLTPLSDPKSDEVGRKNMRIGVGLGGICDFDWTGPQLARWFQEVRQEANEYADALGVNRPITVSTTKPSGTVSLLNGSSPGIHAPYAKYYVRRTRIAKNDPMAEAMVDAKVPFEEDTYDKTGRTWVFEFPMAAPHARVMGQTEDIRTQFERQDAIQTWWADNAVSATLNYNLAESEVLATCLGEFVPRLKSTTCLPRSHGYAQPPYESTSEEDYRERMSVINHDHPLVKDGDIEIDECATGSCPVR